MGKKKKQSILWRATKATFRGMGKIIAGTYKFTKRKIKESNQKKKLEKNKVYNSNHILDELKIMKTISGDPTIFLERLSKDSLIILIFGKRGSGKTSLGIRLLENIKAKTNRECCVLGMENSILPNWINNVEKVEDARNNSIILVDEGAISFGSRDSMSSKNKELSKLLAIARHKNLTLIFVTQNTGMIDKNILKLADTLIVKEGSLLQLEMERQEMQKFYKKSDAEFSTIKGDRRSHAYVIDSDFEGVISYTLPSFWTEDISKNRA